MGVTAARVEQPLASDDLLEAIAANAGAVDRCGATLDREIAMLREAGWLDACLPVGAGGCGWGTSAEGVLSAIDALRALGRANLSVARLFEGHMNAAKLLAIHEPRLLDDRAGGGLMGVWGADVPGEEVAIRHGGSEPVLRGAKRFASGVGTVEYAIVSADRDGETQLLLMPVGETDRADASSWTVDGMRATASGTYCFDGLPVASSSFVGPPGAYYVEPHFEGGIWRYCAAHLGAAEMLYETMRSMLVREGRATDPHQQRRIVEMAIALETARLWIVRAAEAVEAHDARPETATLSLLAREAVARCCREAIDAVEQGLGTRAHVTGTVVERVRRDLSFYLCQAAPDAKRARAAQTLGAMQGLPEAL